MKRRLKWIVAVLGIAGVLLGMVVGFVAWRTKCVPAWYAQAIDCPQWPADLVEKQQLIPLQNWLARTSAGDLDLKPDDEKRHTIELTETQINALLAKWTDNLHGDIETFRVKLQPDGMAVTGEWTAQQRTIGMILRIGSTPEGSPQLSADSLVLGAQALPRSWVLADPIRRTEAYLANLLHSDQPLRIDDHDIATKHTARLILGRAALALLQGDAVGPNALISPHLVLDDSIAVRVTQLRVEQDRLIMEVQMLSSAEREAWAKQLAEAPQTAR